MKYTTHFNDFVIGFQGLSLFPFYFLLQKKRTIDDETLFCSDEILADVLDSKVRLIPAKLYLNSPKGYSRKIINAQTDHNTYKNYIKYIVTLTPWTIFRVSLTSWSRKKWEKLGPAQTRTRQYVAASSSTGSVLHGFLHLLNFSFKHVLVKEKWNPVIQWLNVKITLFTLTNDVWEWPW